MKMNYNEWNINQNSIFYELNELTPNSIINVLGVEQLNLYYSINHGEKTIAPSLERVSTQAVANMINNMYMKKWEQLVNIYLNDLELGFDYSTTTDSNSVGTSNKDVSTNSTQKVSAYNDEEMSDVSGEIDSLNEAGDNETTSNVTVLHKTLKSIDFQRNLLENSNITNAICKDIAELISLSIY